MPLGIPRDARERVVQNLCLQGYLVRTEGPHGDVYRPSPDEERSALLGRLSSRPVSARLTNDVAAHVAKIAQAHGVTQSQFIALAMSRYVFGPADLYDELRDWMGSGYPESCGLAKRK